MNFIDTHTHLYLSEFDIDRSEMVQRSIDHHVNKCILPNIDSTSIPLINKMREEFPNFSYKAMGLHPTSVKEDFQDELNIVYDELKKGDSIAVGEMGIDLYWDKSFYEQQKEAFRIQVKWAKELNLPLIIHSRDSFNEIFELMDEVWDENLQGVFHCFSGNSEQAERIVNDYKFKLGIGGVLTFKNSKLDEALSGIEIEHIILETDAPFLSPVPYRGKRNESSYIPFIAQKISEINSISVEEVSDITTKNAQELFNI